MNNINEKAVLLSDIEFLEMHSSDWERLEEASFDVDLIQTLNEKQHKVLSWLKLYKHTEAGMPIDTVAVFWRERNYLGQPSSWRLNSQEQAQVLMEFSKWVIEQEEA